MASNARGPAGDGASDDNADDAPKPMPADPPPPSLLDLGNGEALVIGTADDFRAAAEWLRRNYPGGTQGERAGPWFGPVLNMKIHHSQMLRDFARLPNETLRDERLSIAARGHLAYLLSLPDGWNTTADAESKRARSLRGKRGEGRDAMRRIYAELKDAGYIYYARVQDNGVFSTVIHVADRPRTEAEWRASAKAATDVRLTDVPETRMSVPPAEMPEPVDNWPGEFSQVAPMYGSPGVGTPDVGTPVHRQPVHSYEDGTTEDEKIEPWRVDGEAGDWGARGNHPRHQEDDDQGQGQERSATNWQNRPVRHGSGTVAGEAQEIPFNDSESATAGTGTRASEPDALANGHRGHAESPGQEQGGAGAPLSEPANPAGSDATRTPAADPEEHQRRTIAEFEAWMREHPEAAGAQ